MQVGLQTEDPHADYSFLESINEVSVRIVFLTEFVVKIVAEGAKPQLYFCEGWNLFGKREGRRAESE